MVTVTATTKRSKALTGRFAFWSAAVVPLLAMVFLGLYLGGAAPAVAAALMHEFFAPLAVFVLRAVTLVYFLPLALRGISPSPIFVGLVAYLIAGLALLGLSRWRRAAIVLLLPLLCTIPLSVIGLHAADGQTAPVRGTFSSAMNARWSEDVVDSAAVEQSATVRDVQENVTKIYYRFVVFSASGSKATVASVVTMVRTWQAKSDDGTWKEYRREFKNDYSAQMVRRSSSYWVVTSLSTDFHPGYEP